jgi:hypothetical protein
MTLSRIYVDGFLIQWEAEEYKAQVKSLRQRSEELVPVVPIPPKGSGKREASRAKRAQAIRERLARTVRKAPEVMVKITSSSKGIRQIARHLDYISRKGQIDVEDQDGAIVRGRDELKDLKEIWRYGGPEEIGDVSERRDTLNIVFSMPAHTDEVSLKRAVRAFANQAFEGHQYVFAYHTQATDPDPNPPAHPHVHLSVKVDGQDGRRMNPRKADLQRWREDFAASLRAHGIEANATSRLARLQKHRGAKRSVLAVEERNEPLYSVGKGRGNKPRAERLEADRITYYGLASEVLAQSDDPADRKLAGDLNGYLEAMKPGHGPEPLAAITKRHLDLGGRDI